MTVLLVASVISMIRTNPEYGAWDAELVKPKRLIWNLQFSNHFCLPGCNCNETISKLGHVDSAGNDLCWHSADAPRLSSETFPDSQSWSRYSSRLNSTQWDNSFNEGNDWPRWRCKYRNFVTKNCFRNIVKMVWDRWFLLTKEVFRNFWRSFEEVRLRWLTKIHRYPLFVESW